MRRLVIASALFLVGCAARPQQPEPAAPAPVIARPAPAGSHLLGMTVQELVSRLGNPAMQIREGTSVKLQFRDPVCVLDAYLYPSGTGSGPLRVTHIDTRAPSGADYNQAACVTALEQSI